MCSARFIYAGLFLILAAGFAEAQDAEKKPIKPRVEVVFCLDTTGSMGGLINAAKNKIWSICNQIVSGTPTPDVHIGLLAYRDRGDAYITKLFDLTDDLDAMHKSLMSLEALGGGDAPESVNQALHESVTKFKWSQDKKTLKIIFLVGDAPPHMDYDNDVKYRESCKLAVTSNIIINTVQCGDDSECQRIWREISSLAEGKYVQIDAAGGRVIASSTPFDKELAKLNDELNRSQLFTGSVGSQHAAKESLSSSSGAAFASGGIGGKGKASIKEDAAADRAAILSRNSGATANDLLNQLKAGKVKLEDIKEADLPEEIQKMTPEQRKEYLKKIETERAELSKKALELNQKRSEYLAAQQKESQKNQTKDSFDSQVLQMLQSQANRTGNLRYEGAKEKK